MPPGYVFHPKNKNPFVLCTEERMGNAVLCWSDSQKGDEAQVE